ncbi:MAG: DUF1552 domain-containing protein [Verrucomicrobiales bacterium]
MSFPVEGEEDHDRCRGRDHHGPDRSRSCRSVHAGLQRSDGHGASELQHWLRLHLDLLGLPLLEQPDHPAPKEIFPQQAFDQLFDDGSKRVRDKSILDLVMDDAKSLRPKLSHRDGQKLDEYLGSVRDLEQRIAKAEQFSKAETGGQGWTPTVKTPTIPRPGPGIPALAEEHLRLMFDILVLAFQMDRTGCYLHDEQDLICASPDWMASAGIHLSHHAGDETRLSMYQRVNEYQVKLWGSSPKCRQPTRASAPCWRTA